MSDGSLLPPNATSQERALSLAVARVGAVPVPITDVWNPDTCPAGLLAYLAWAFSVDEWDASWSDESKRATIREAMQVQARKGTLDSIRRVLTNAGYGAAQIIEGIYTAFFDGAAKFDGRQTYADGTRWALYRVILERPITNVQADQVRRILNYTAPARCVLSALDFTRAANSYNGASSYDGAFNYGTA